MFDANDLKKLDGLPTDPTYYQPLVDDGFNATHIVNIAGSKGGCKAVINLRKHIEQGHIRFIKEILKDLKDVKPSTTFRTDPKSVTEKIATIMTKSNAGAALQVFVDMLENEDIKNWLKQYSYRMKRIFNFLNYDSKAQNMELLLYIFSHEHLRGLLDSHENFVKLLEIIRDLSVKDVNQTRNKLVCYQDIEGQREEFVKMFNLRSFGKFDPKNTVKHPRIEDKPGSALVQSSTDTGEIDMGTTVNTFEPRGVVRVSQLSMFQAVEQPNPKYSDPNRDYLLELFAGEEKRLLEIHQKLEEYSVHAATNSLYFPLCENVSKLLVKAIQVTADLGKIYSDLSVLPSLGEYLDYLNNSIILVDHLLQNYNKENDSLYDNAIRDLCINFQKINSEIHAQLDPYVEEPESETKRVRTL